MGLLGAAQLYSGLKYRVNLATPCSVSTSTREQGFKVTVPVRANVARRVPGMAAQKLLDKHRTTARSSLKTPTDRLSDTPPTF